MKKKRCFGIAVILVLSCLLLNCGGGSGSGGGEISDSGWDLSFQGRHCYAAGDGPFSVAMGDVDGDGDLDLAVANSTDGTVSVLLNNGIE